MARTTYQLKRVHATDRLDYSLKIAKPMREVQRLNELVESKDPELQTMLRLVEKASRLREKLFRLKGNKIQLLAEIRVVLALGTEISELKTRTDFLVGCLQEVNDLVVETERDLKKAQETVAASESHERTKTNNVSSLTEELSLVRVRRANFLVDLNEMAGLMERMKNDVEWCCITCPQRCRRRTRIRSRWSS